MKVTSIIYLLNGLHFLMIPQHTCIGNSCFTEGQETL